MKSAWPEHPDYKINISLYPKRVRVIVQGETVADSQQVLLVEEQEHAPVYYFPPADVRTELLHKAEKSTFCPFKGEADHWTLQLESARFEAVLWSYASPFDEVKEITDHFAFYPEVAGNMVEE